MRELTSSLLSFAWAQTLYTIQQITGLERLLTGAPATGQAVPGHLVETLRPALHNDDIPVMMPDQAMRFETPRGVSEAVAMPSPQAPGWGPMP